MSSRGSARLYKSGKTYTSHIIREKYATVESCKLLDTIAQFSFPYILYFVCFTNCFAAICRSLGGRGCTTNHNVIDCTNNLEISTVFASSTFEKCGNKIKANGNITKVNIGQCEVNKFPIEQFDFFQNMTGIAIWNFYH